MKLFLPAPDLFGPGSIFLGLVIGFPSSPFLALLLFIYHALSDMGRHLLWPGVGAG